MWTLPAHPSFNKTSKMHWFYNIFDTFTGPMLSHQWRVNKNASWPTVAPKGTPGKRPNHLFQTFLDVFLGPDKKGGRPDARTHARTDGRTPGRHPTPLHNACRKKIRRSGQGPPSLRPKKTPKNPTETVYKLSQHRAPTANFSFVVRVHVR